MTGTILVFIENNIATRLLLSTHLTALGYEVTFASRPRVFRSLLEAWSVDWLVLEGTAIAQVPDLLVDVMHYKRLARIVWLGRPPRRRELPDVAFEAHKQLLSTTVVYFTTPLGYNAIAQYFAVVGPRDRDAAASAELAPREESQKLRRAPERRRGPP